MNSDPSSRTLGLATERMMGMSDEVWDRHANPWSGWTRLATLPLLAIAVWSRVWLGWWSLVPVVLVLIWTWINPRLFPRPESTDNWMSRGVIGERIWLSHKQYQHRIAAHHQQVIRALIALSMAGAGLLLVGLVLLDLALVLTGLSVTMIGKLWFLDRMVWIQREATAPPDDRTDPAATRVETSS